MRDYSTIASTFWTGKTGRALRSDHNSQLLAMYLVTAPSANMIGLYYIPIVTMAHDTGLTEAEVMASLKALASADGFLDWDEETETVFVRTMARRQIGLAPGSTMKPGDKRVGAIIRMLGDVSNERQLDMFWQEYSGMLPLPGPWWKPLSANEKPLPASKVASTGPKVVDKDHKVAPKLGTDLALSESLLTQDKYFVQERGMQGGEPLPEGTRGGTPPHTPPPPAQKSKRRGKTPETSIPEGWSPNARHAELAAELGLSRKLKSEAQNFIDHAHAHGRKLANWNSGFSMWLRKASEWANDRNDLGDSKEPPPAHQELALPIFDNVLTHLPEVDLD